MPSTAVGIYDHVSPNYSLQDHSAKVSGSESCAQIVGRDHRRRSANNLKKMVEL
jgi:hypothetical protein